MSVQLKMKYFNTPEEAEAYRQGFKDFCQSLQSQLESKGPHTFFENTKSVTSFESFLSAKKELPEPPKSEGFWQAIQSHTNKVMGVNGHSQKHNSFLDLFRRNG